jgi:general transcription factor 3C polypeptide 3 (transcription factor C subunit 4)
MTHLAAAVAIYVKDYRTAVDHARKIITGHQFNNEPLRILIASLSSGLLPTDAFITSTLQKHLFREMKLSDTAVKNPDMLKWNPLNKRYAPTGSKVAEHEHEQDDDENDEVNKEDEGAGPSASATTSQSREQANLPPIPTKFNPVIIAIYGQICISAKSYQSAICSFKSSCLTLRY